MPEIVVLGEKPDGRPLRGYEVDYKTLDEPWAEYLLEPSKDKVRIKHALLKIYRLVNDDGTPAFTNSGDPEIYVNGTIIVTSSKAK